MVSWFLIFHYFEMKGGKIRCLLCLPVRSGSSNNPSSSSTAASAPAQLVLSGLSSVMVDKCSCQHAPNMLVEKWGKNPVKL